MQIEAGMCFGFGYVVFFVSFVGDAGVGIGAERIHQEKCRHFLKHSRKSGGKKQRFGFCRIWDEHVRGRS